MKPLIALVLVLFRLFGLALPGEVSVSEVDVSEVSENEINENLSIVQENLYVYEGEDTGYFFAKIQNTGSEAVGLDSGSLDILSENGDVLLSRDYVMATVGRAVLQPGDYAYVSEFLWESTLLDAPVSAMSHEFSMTAGEMAQEIAQVPCEAAFDLPGTDSYENYIYVTFTNTTDEPRNDFIITVALLDKDDKLLLVSYDNPTSIAVHPGSTVTVRIYVDSNMMAHYEAQGLEPVRVDAIVSYPVA